MKLRRLGLALYFAVAGALLGGHPYAADAKDTCTAADDALGTVSAMPDVAKVLHPGGRLNVLAIGSATMFGPEASLSPGTLASQAMSNASKPSIPPSQPITQDATEKSFPRQMASTLESAVPGVSVQITVRGGRGMTAADMLAVFAAERIGALALAGDWAGVERMKAIAGKLEEMMETP